MNHLQSLQFEKSPLNAEQERWKATGHFLVQGSVEEDGNSFHNKYGHNDAGHFSVDARTPNDERQFLTTLVARWFRFGISDV
jgi:hypothetical protein